MEKKKDYKKDNPNIRMSKAMSWLLRHGAVKEGVRINADGYVRMNDLLDYLAKEKGYNDLKVGKIMQIVNTNDKKRFQVKEDIDPQGDAKVLWIRAAQGHTMEEVETEQLLKKIEDPTLYPVVVHGTYKKVIDLIKAQGLKRMARNHIHFAPGFPKDNVISGMRGNCDVVVEIDMEAAMKDGIKFYISSNSVILTEGVDGVLPPKYFKKIHEK